MRSTFSFIATFFLFASSLSAQISSFQEEYPSLHNINEEESQQKITGTPLTLPFSLTQPFVDDFSDRRQGIDTNKWYIDASKRQALKYHHGTTNNPTEGVLTFDGLTSEGKPYNVILSSGQTDRIESHYIDLSAYSPSDSIMLSFYLAPGGGFGDMPEPADSFRVLFKDTAGVWNSVYKMSVSSSTTNPTPSTFAYQILPIINPAFFHNQFQIRFQSYGNQNGHIDLWHLDYVYLAMNRSVVDYTINDVAIKDLKPPLLFPYTAIPYQQYVGNNLLQTAAVEVNNLSNSLVSTTLDMQLTDPVANNVFTIGNSQSTAAPLFPQSGFSQNILAFLNQTMPPLSVSYQVDATVSPNTDLIPQNNYYQELTRVDSLLSFDDGEAEGSFGVTSATSYGQQYEVSSKDYLRAVWICFSPRVNYNVSTQQSFYMNQHDFKITIWNQAHPDSILYYQDNVKVQYGDSLHTFYRYRLYDTVSVKGTIWIGITQKDDLPLGVGLDKNFAANNKIFWQVGNTWVNSNVYGCLMIRPEFQNVNYNPLPVSIKELETTTNLFHIYPNPSTEDAIHASIPQNCQTYTYQIWDMQGKKMKEDEFVQPAQDLIISSAMLSKGCYIVKHTALMENGKTIFQYEKWVNQ